MMAYQMSLEPTVTRPRAAKSVLQAENSKHPTPIPGCEAPFNHYLGERQKGAEALAALAGQPLVPASRTPGEAAMVDSR